MSSELRKQKWENSIESPEMRKQNHKNGAIKSVWLDFCEQKCILNN